MRKGAQKEECGRPGVKGHGGGTPALEVGQEGNPAVSCRQQGTADLQHWLPHQKLRVVA